MPAQVGLASGRVAPVATSLPALTSLAVLVPRFLLCRTPSGSYRISGPAVEGVNGY